MKYLIYNTIEEAELRNKQEAISRDSGGVLDVTKFWWPMENINEQWCLLVGDDTILSGETIVEI